MVSPLSVEPALVDPGKLDALSGDRWVLFPIRHHSPSCARHLARLMRERRPTTVLVEGPASFTSLIPLLLHPDAEPPFAIYATVGSGRGTLEDRSLGVPRQRAYYFPFAACSPERVALQVGSELGAHLAFIDLDLHHPDRFPDHRQPDGPWRTESLMAEPQFRHSRFLQRLAQRTGCRDHEELWDHLFESRLHSEEPPERFLREVAAWCHYARLEATEESLRADGTLARELAMADAVRFHLARSSGLVLVVTGGFHTLALLDRLTAVDIRGGGVGAPANAATGESKPCLVRYGFEALDALNGYAAGMPSPYFHHRLWQATLAHPDRAPWNEVAGRFLVELGRNTRERRSSLAVSTPDLVAALHQACQLAALRGHPGPLREDLLDAIRSCYVKGAMDGEGESILVLARHLLGGTAVGKVPAEAGLPPLVTAFLAAARRLRLPAADSVRRKVTLELYRRAAHRETSRLLYILEFLEVPYGRRVAGPDFVQGTHLDLRQEHWECGWTPGTEPALLEAGALGATLEEAAGVRWTQAMERVAKQGSVHPSEDTVGLLNQACRMGLHDTVRPALEFLRHGLDTDPSLPSLAAAAQQLLLLWESREPLEAHRLPEVPRLLKAAYQRACFLLHHAHATAESEVESHLTALVTMGSLPESGTAQEAGLDPALYREPALRLAGHPQAPPLLAGGAAGMLHRSGQLKDETLFRLLSGALHAASDPGRHTAFLVGLLRAHRALAWREPVILKAVQELMAGWSEETFLAQVPHLRLAFADLSPGETARVATSVNALVGPSSSSPLVPWVTFDLTENQAILALRVQHEVQRSLERDGLAHWLPPTPQP